MNPSILKRKEREKEERKKNILNTAANLFARKGFHHVKMDDIAEEVGLSKGTLYLYFDNKEMLFTSIIIEKSHQLNEQLKSTLNCKNEYIDCLKLFIKSTVEFFMENRPYFKLLHSEKMSTTLEEHYKLHDYLTQSMQTMHLLVTKIILLGKEKNFFKNINEVIIVKSLRGIINSFLLDIMMQEDVIDIDTTVNDILIVFLNGVQA